MDERGVNGQDSQTEVERLPSDPTQGPPAVPQSPLAHSAEVLVDTLAELAAGSHGAFQRQESVMPSESESEREDDYEQLDFGPVLGEADLRELQLEARRFLKRRLGQLRLRPRQILVRDKVAFVLGTLDLWLSAYWLGCSPQSFYRLYTVKAALLMAIRWVTYRMKKWHYYLWDLCYAAQILLLLQLWAYPTSITLTKVCFALNLGPLLWSIIAFRNSLVYHSVDKVTSLFLHWFPACVSWAARWHPDPRMAALLESSPAARQRWEAGHFWELSLLPLLPYTVWALGYYFKIFVVSSSKIQQRGYDTLYKYSTRSKKSVFGAVVLRFPQKLQPVVYMGMHLVLSVVAMMFNSLWWSNYTACTLFMLSVFTVSAWNGASFYFDVFAHRYVTGLGLELREKRRAASQDTSTPPTPSTASRRKAD
ncbi:hypothetical protein N2152v2_011202 [Parachlorella kessleri]